MLPPQAKYHFEDERTKLLCLKRVICRRMLDDHGLLRGA